MLLFRTIAIVFLIITLSACGFKAMYGENNLAGASILVQRPDIEIDNIPNQTGQYLRNALIFY